MMYYNHYGYCTDICQVFVAHPRYVWTVDAVKRAATVSHLVRSGLKSQWTRKLKPGSHLDDATMSSLENLLIAISYRC